MTIRVLLYARRNGTRNKRSKITRSSVTFSAMPPLDAPDAICPSVSIQMTPTVSLMQSPSGTNGDDWLSSPFDRLTSLSDKENAKLDIDKKRHRYTKKKLRENAAKGRLPYCIKKQKEETPSS